jgi:hypothetical protein
MLEDRTVPDVQGFAVGPMYLYGDFFMDTQNNWWAKGEVKIGFAPGANQPFEELAVFSTSPDGKVWFSPDNPNPEFTVEQAELISMVSVPHLTLWETENAVTFNAAALASATGGVNIYAGAKPVTVLAGHFTMDNLRFVDPDGEGGEKGQIWMQGSLTQAPLTGVSMTVAGTNFVKLTESGVVLTGVSEAFSGGLSVGGLGFSIANLSVSYSDETFTITGSAQISLTENESVQVIFASPGLQISGGQILTFPLVLNSDLTFSGVHFATKNLRFNYADDTFTLTGQVQATIGNQSLTVTFGQGGTAGLKIVNGELTDLDMMFQGKLSLLGLEVELGTQTNPITITYSHATATTPSLFTLSGQLTVPQLWNASVILGSQGHPGLVVQDGDFQLEDVRLELSDVNLGALTIDELLVAFTSNTFAITLDLWFPAGWKVKGYVQWEDGQLNGIDLGLEGNEGIEIADTGIMITGFEAGVYNLQHPANIIVTGKLEAVWLSKNFVQIEGDFTVDADELVLHGNIEFLDGVGKGDVRLVLDWGEQDYSATVKVDWLDGLFKFDAIMDIHDGDSVYVKGRADVDVPDDIPFIGGQTLAEIDFVLEWRKNRPDEENFVAAWVDLDFFFFSIDVGVKVDFTGHPSLIGSSFIHKIDSPPPDSQPKIYHYRIPFSVPENVTHGTLQVRWPEVGGNQSVAIVRPDGTTITQSQFTDRSYNLTLLAPLTSRQSYGVGMAGLSTDPFVTLTPGTYQLVLTSNYKFSSPPKLTASFGTARPTIESLVVQPPTSLSTVVSLSGRVASSLGPNARITLYVDRDNTGYDGTPIPGATNLPISVDAQGHWTVQANWNMDGLMPWQYYVYASINDGVNAPVHSAYSAPTTPNPALYGTVTTYNQSFRESGLLVFVDTNNNGQFDPGVDPYTSTNSFGLYGFDSAALPLNTPFRVGLILPSGFQMHGGSPNIVENLTYNGIDGLLVNFVVDEFASIHGQVTANFDVGSQPLSAWTVYLDANNNGSLDEGEVRTLTAVDGSYVFRHLPLNTTQIVRVVVPDGYYLTSFDARIVNVSNDPFELYRHNDFTALPFSTISGTVTGYSLHNGTLSSTAGPLVRLVRSFNIGGSALNGYQADPGPTNVGTKVGNAIKPVDTSRAINPAPQRIYQSYRYGQSFTYAINGLTPNASYVVRLHFAELYWSAAGKRLFNVAINGQPVLSNYDIFAKAGGAFIAIVESFTATTDANGQISVVFTAVTDNAQINAIEVGVSIPTTVQLLQAAESLNIGGSASNGYQADPGATSGSTQTASNFDHPIDTSRVVNPAPQVVYQSNRYGQSFTYTMTGLTPNAPHLVRLHLAELYWSAAGKRLFNVTINGQPVLRSYDIFAQAGGAFIATVESFTVTADAHGTINLAFTTVIDNAQINGIEISEIVATTTTDANGNYSFGGLKAGTYTVAQVPPSGWRVVAPATSDLHLQSPSGSNVWHLPSLPGDPKPIDVGVADFDGDGKLDVAVLYAVSNETNNQSYVFLYYNGDWQNPVRYGLEYGTNYQKMVIGDFWGIGRPSIAFFGLSEQRYHGRIDALMNIAASRTKNFGDLIYDTWELQNYDRGDVGDFVLLPLDKGSDYESYDNLGVFYWNKDGHPTISIVNLDGPNGAAYNYATLVDAAVPQQMLSVDVNGDGYHDLIISDRWRSPSILFGSLSPNYNRDNATYTALGHQTTVSVLPSAYHILAADINGDGLMDLGVFDTNGEFHYAIQDQTGNFSAISPGLGVLGKTVGSAFFRDVNGDLLPDLIWVVQGVGAQAVHVVLNTGETGRWFRHANDTIWGLVTSPTGDVRLTAGDLDGDGLAELIVIDKEARTVQVLSNKSVSRPTPITVTVDGNASTGNNFVNAQNGQVGGKVFADRDRDGRLTGSEPGLAGATVFVDLNRNGRLDRGEPRMVTGVDGLYAFDGLAPGTYHIRVLPQVGQKVTIPGAELHRIRIGAGSTTQLDKHFGSVSATDVTLKVPSQSHALRLFRSGDRLEVLDRVRGVMASYSLAEIHSLTIIGGVNQRTRVVLDLFKGGSFYLPGGITFRAGAGHQDALRLVLGNSPDHIHISAHQVRINHRLTLRWSGMEVLAVDSNGGNDLLSVHGMPLAAGTVLLKGGSGHDTYTLATRATALWIQDSDGLDTLDFAAALSGVQVDLTSSRFQSLDILGNRLRLGGTFENVLGSRFADYLLGGPGRNILIGGMGADVLLGRSGEDILIGATVSFNDSGLLALQAIAAEWHSPRSYRERVQNLIDGTGSQERLNGDAFLHSATLSDDGETDRLFGGSARDWFVPFPQDRLGDRESDERSGW